MEGNYILFSSSLRLLQQKATTVPDGPHGMRGLAAQAGYRGRGGRAAAGFMITVDTGMTWRRLVVTAPLPQWQAI